MANERTHTIDIGNDFALRPWGRTRKKHGLFSGEVFREDLLKPSLEEFDRITIVLTNARGLGTSFLHEAICKVAYDYKWDIDTFRKHIAIVSEVIPELSGLIFEFAEQEYERRVLADKRSLN